MPMPTPSSFPINRMPVEVRLHIWEATWPGPRIIEVVDRYRPIHLEMTDTIRNFLNCVDRLDPEDESYEEVIRHPIALYICHESRFHTQKKFVKFRHGDYSFYLNPSIDILWAQREMRHAREVPPYHPNYVWEELKKTYGTQLETAIKNVAITMEDAHWADAITRLAYFRGATRLQIFLDANPSPREVKLMKRVAESSFPSPSSNVPVRLGLSRRYHMEEYLIAPSPDRPVLAESTRITDDYPTQKTVLVELRDAKYTLLHSYDACRRLYWWRINNGGGGLDPRSGPFSDDNSEDGSEDNSEYDGEDDSRDDSEDDSGHDGEDESQDDSY